MSVVTSSEFRKWATANDNADPYIFLLEITHPSLSAPIRVSSDMTEFIQLHNETKEPIYGTRHNGVVYYALPFKFTVPDQPEGSDPIKAQVSIDNIDREYVAAIRNMESAASFTVKTVFASSRNEVQQEFPVLRITSATYNASTIDAELGPDDYRAEPCPAMNFYPALFPGLF